MQSIGIAIIWVINAFVDWIKSSPTVQSFVFLGESLGKLAIFIAIISYIIEYPNREKQRYYQAWQAINSARMSTGDGGRRKAIGDLIDMNNDLRGIDLTNATIEGFDLRGVFMPDSHFNSASISDTLFSCKPSMMALMRSCQRTVMTGAFFGTDTQEISGTNNQLTVKITNNHFESSQMNGTTLQNAILEKNIFEDADMESVYFSSVTFNKANSFKNSHLDRAHLRNIQYNAVGSGKDINVDLTGAFLNDATYDGKPISPDDLRSDVVRLCRTTFSTPTADLRPYVAKLCKTNVSATAFICNRDC
jgi:uncharacterized protein YjbI with pentapeptide repeats